MHFLHLNLNTIGAVGAEFVWQSWQLTWCFYRCGFPLDRPRTTTLGLFTRDVLECEKHVMLLCELSR